MESKYYIPKIDEFHVGFEYEFKNLEDISSNCIYNSLDFIGWDNGWKDEDLVSHLQEHIDYGNIRVKYLDKEDINSLGFKDSFVPNCYMDDDEMEDGYELFVSNTDMILIHLNKDGMYGVVRQHIYNLNTLNWTAYNLFYGKIKNKSEFNRLLKQLNIINE